MSTPSLHSVLNAVSHSPKWELEYHGFRLTASESDDTGTLAHLLDHLLPVLEQVARHADTASARTTAPLPPRVLHSESVAPPEQTVMNLDVETVPTSPGILREVTEPTPAATFVPPVAASAISRNQTVQANGELPHDLKGLRDIHMLQYERDGSPDSTGEAIGICLDLFISVNGNKNSKQVNILDMERFLGALSTWPKNRQFIKGVDKMTPAELSMHAANNKLPAIAVGTQEKYVQHLSAFFNRLKTWDRCDSNPVLLINRRKHFGDQQKHTKRSFNNPEWQRPFQKDEMAAANAPWKFFGHLIPAFTGSRSNEIGQLKRSDVRVVRMPDRDGVVHDVLCLHLGQGKKRKSKNAVRVIPVPKQILALGFENYLQDLDAFGEHDLFPGLRISEGRPGGTIENWFNGKLRTDWGILDKKITFHCFRHTIATLMRNARTPLAVRHALMGHSSKPRPGATPNGNTVAEEHYEDVVTPLDILNELGRLPFPELDVAPYERGMFDHYLRCEGVRRRSNEKRIEAGESPLPKRGPVAGFCPAGKSAKDKTVKAT